jgi:hypothetical protein
MNPESLSIDPDDFLESLDNGLDEQTLIQLVENHKPYLHFGECTLCDGIFDYFVAEELDFKFVVALIAADRTATAAVQELALNSALDQSEADATAELAWALAQNPSCTSESLKNCTEVDSSLAIFRLVYNHPNVSQETKDSIVDEVDFDESKLR